MTLPRFCILALILSALLFGAFRNDAADKPANAKFEYVTLRWGGRDNTSIIRPDGSVEVTRTLFTQSRKPDRVDERSYYMNVGMNALAREGFEVVAMTSDDVLFKRSVGN